jgi:hypothetical protein
LKRVSMKHPLKKCSLTGGSWIKEFPWLSCICTLSVMPLTSDIRVTHLFCSADANVTHERLEMLRQNQVWSPEFDNLP